MKVFANTNYAGGIAGANIPANTVVTLSTTTGLVIPAVAASVPIGVTHNYATDAGQPVTMIPIGPIIRVKAGDALALTDLTAAVGADADGKIVTTPTTPLGILVGLSADLEGATAAVADDDVSVMLTGIHMTVVSGD